MVTWIHKIVDRAPCIHLPK